MSGGVQQNRVGNVCMVTTNVTVMCASLAAYTTVTLVLTPARRRVSAGQPNSASNVKRRLHSETRLAWRFAGVGVVFYNSDE